jgi:hypothetical protein
MVQFRDRVRHAGLCRAGGNRRGAGDPGHPAVALLGDGGFQFTLSELGSARDCGADVAFLVWNNSGYREIETSMLSAGVTPIGVTPSAPDFQAIAEAYGLAIAKGDVCARVDRRAENPAPALLDRICRKPANLIRLSRLLCFDQSRSCASSRSMNASPAAKLLEREEFIGLVGLGNVARPADHG